MSNQSGVGRMTWELVMGLLLIKPTALACGIKKTFRLIYLIPTHDDECN